ncbi:MAG: hypothetical protein IKU52_08275 [Clostridia bacterium]|nr:hypothetical protein [Clostridia bacterium]
MNSYSPPKKNKLHIYLPVIFICLSFTFLVFARLDQKIPDAVFNFFTILFAALAIQIVTRYSLTKFVYEIDTQRDVFKVVKITGKKITLAGEIDFGDIVSIIKKEKNVSPYENNKRFKNHNFCNNIFPENPYYMILSVADEDICVTIEANQSFIELIENYRNTIIKGENL